MRKFTKIGIVLIIVAFFLFYFSSLQFQNNLQNSTIHSLRISPHGSAVVPISIANISAVGALFYSNGTNLTFYVMNSQAYAALSPYLNSSTMVNKSQAFTGNGVYEIIYNNVSGVFPYQGPGQLLPPSYTSGSVPILQNGTYYEVFQDLSAKQATVYYSTINRVQASFNNAMVASSIYGLLGALLLIAGIASIGYSYISKKEGVVEVVKDGNVDSMFEKYSIKDTKPSKPSKARKSRRK